MSPTPRAPRLPSAPAVAALLALAASVIGGCAAKPQLSPWQGTALLPALPERCGDAADAATVMPGGISVVHSEGRDVILVAGRGCVLTVDAATGAADLLPTHGDSIAPTMVDGESFGLAFSSGLSGSVRAIDTAGAITFNVSGLRYPIGVRLMPGGTALVAEYGAGRIMRVGPASDTRTKLVLEGLNGPVGLVAVDATRGYVTEMLAGRVSEFRLDRFERTTVVDGLSFPEGIALLPNGRLVVAEVGKRRVIAVDPATKTIEVLADGLPVGLASELGAGDPNAVTDVAASPDGTIYVSADIDRTILRLTRRPPPPAK